MKTMNQKCELELLVKAVPKEVRYDNIVGFNNLDERISAVGVLYTNTIGVCRGYIEFCPDNDPALREEVLSWIWAFRPDLGDAILSLDVSDDLRMLIESYRDGVMEKYWEYVTN